MKPKPQWPSWPAWDKAQQKAQQEKLNKEAKKKHLSDIEFLNQNERGK